MRSRRLYLVLLLPILAGARLHAQQAPSAEQIDALMAQSGLQRQIAVLPPQIEQRILNQDAGLDPQRVAAFRKAMTTAFAADRMQARARDFLQTKVSREDAEQIAQWYASPLGGRIRDLELKTGQPQTADRQGDLAQIVGAERLKRIERIEFAQEAVTALFLWFTHVGTTFNKIQYLVWGIDSSREAPPIALTPELKSKMLTMMILARADALRELTIEELDRYVTFAESPAARRWYPAMWDAIEVVMSKGSEEVMAAMASAPK